jgi:catechol 2,3-dioxygenase-like lactoylglutathione lyase family enzyme
MPGLLLNIDVPDLEAGIAFYTAALGLSVSRRFDSGFAELTGAAAPIYLLENAPGTPNRPGRAGATRLCPPLDPGAHRFHRRGS